LLIPDMADVALHNYRINENHIHDTIQIQ